MDHCKDCKFWDEYRSSEVGECLRPNHPGALFAPQGYEESGALVTYPSFGCIQFEAK